jgi:hypothetical protein
MRVVTQCVSLRSTAAPLVAKQAGLLPTRKGQKTGAYFDCWIAQASRETRGLANKMRRGWDSNPGRPEALAVFKMAYGLRER